jgi:hypothetical protein
MVNKRFCDFCGEEIIPYKNDISEDDINFNSKIKPGYNGDVQLSIKVCTRKDAFGHRHENDACKDCIKEIIKQM